MSQNVELFTQMQAGLDMGVGADALPRSSAIPLRGTPDALTAELRALARAIFFSGDSPAPAVVLFCGVDQDSGGSRICRELGPILASQSTRPVCLLNVNGPASPSQRLAEGRISTPEPAADSYTELGPNLWAGEIGVDGSPTHIEVAHPREISQQLEELRTRFEFTLLSAPGVRAYADAAVPGRGVDGAVLVIDANTTRKAAALRAKADLERMGVRLLGSVLSNRSYPIPDALYRRL